MAFPGYAGPEFLKAIDSGEQVLASLGLSKIEFLSIQIYCADIARNGRKSDDSARREALKAAVMDADELLRYCAQAKGVPVP